MYIPRLVVAGTHSGVGKTTLATGLMISLKRRGRQVQAYKVGPDYIDPSYHAAATGRPSRNLDRWLLGSQLNPVFARSAAGHWAVIEGVMGMYDGLSGTAGYGSTADVAKELKAPVLLIVDAASMARSVAALVHGFRSFDAEVEVAGVILNRVKSAAQERLLRAALKEIDIKVAGCLPREGWIKLPERHLGLVPVGEQALPDEYLDSLANFMDEYMDLDLVESVMLSAREFDALEPRAHGFLPTLVKSLPRQRQSHRTPGHGGKYWRLGIARDEAFLFYYADALELLPAYGFQPVVFSPLHDRELPADLDALFLGGGFPELHLEALSNNHTFLASVRAFVASGRPIYAECGGFMYLGEVVKNFEGKVYPMAGVIPMRTEMTSRLQGMGYREGVLAADTFLGPRGTVVRGHEFHYSKAVFHGTIQPAYTLYRNGQPEGMDGYARDNVVASYVHLHFAGFPELLANWAHWLAAKR